MFLEKSRNFSAKLVAVSPTFLFIMPSVQPYCAASHRVCASDMATDNHRVAVKVIFHLFGGGSKHIGANLTIAQMAYLHIVADRLSVDR